MLRDEPGQLVLGRAEGTPAPEALEFLVGRPIQWQTLPAEELAERLTQLESGDADRFSAESIPDTESDLLSWLDGYIQEIVRANPSDIHFEATPEALRVRYRVAGKMYVPEALPAGLTEAVINRLKLLAGMNVAERRRPQDGKLRLGFPGSPEFRLSTLPTIHGESLVLRVLQPHQHARHLEDLGLTSEQLVAIRTRLARPTGMIVVTGPTGAGKTTTAYALLRELDQPGRKLVTLEDPVEVAFPSAVQLAVGADTGLSFADGLRALLRHDPDVILVGEIRDGETARAAVQAALTGHRVLTTVHAGDAPGVTRRLHNLGVEPFLVQSALQLVIAQELTEIGGDWTGRFHLAVGDAR